ncbi:tetratricopeptide repeat-containing sulfotransferase family protein [Asticcacaulis solisilvae]|uniref:tetratricopeptide repeat-containing sulfotransferase family protein n=1 Tax=Asticcacaulis solisilvae TaxID=1217274 RepID=UPI003FD84AA1
MSASPHPLVLRGRQAFQARDFTAALSLCGMRLKEAPDDLDALELKAVIQQSRGDMKGAEDTMRHALALDPASAWAAHDLTQMLHVQGQTKAAEMAARHALIALPEDPQSHLQLAVILAEYDDLPAAEYHNRQALELAGPHPQILVNLALCLYNQGRLDEAESLFLQACRVAEQPPGARAMAMAHLSRVYEARRDMVNAWLWLDRAEQTGKPAGQDFALLRALYLSNTDKPKEALELIDRAGSRISPAALLDKGRLLDRLGRYEEAWAAMVTAKAKLAQEGKLAYDAPKIAAEFETLRAAFTAKSLARLPRAGTRTDVPQPVFILGFPRSGTTMIEQMLSSHDHVAPGGELPFVHEWQALSTRLLPGTEPYPQRLAEAQAADFHHIPTVLRDYYLGRAEIYGVMGEGRRLFTDKMPLNDAHLPLIRLAFPHAPVIRMLRHPLDVAISILSHNLTHGMNSGFAMETIVTHMIAQHGLDAHYDTIVEQPPLVVRYEDFVAHQEAETRRVLDYCGLGFDEACLRFHENRRHAPTPSYSQVSKPLNDRSIGRWRNYARQLAPWMDRIAPVVEALGYTLDL